MAFISLGTIDKKLLPILFGCIFSILNKLLMTSDQTILFQQKLLPNIIASFAQMLAIIPFIILKIKTRRAKRDSYRIQADNEIELIYSDIKYEIIEDKWKYIILSSVLLFGQGLLLLYTYQIKSNSLIWNIIIISISYFLIFKIKLYKHHYFSLITIVLTELILDLVYENIQNDLSDNLIFFFLRLLKETIYSLFDVVNKYLMEKKFCSVYEILFFNGLINLFLFGAFEILNYYYYDYLKMDDLWKYYNDFNYKEILFIIGIIICQFGLGLSYLITSKNNTPCHICIIALFGKLVNYFEFSLKSIIFFICFVFLLFMELVFNEIIEINICGLSDNTKRNIIKRAKAEDLNLDKNDTIDTFKTITTINSLDEENDEYDENLENDDKKLIELGKGKN